MTRKLLLVNPAQYIKPNLVTVMRLPPASLAYLAALTPSDWDVKVIDENIEPLIFEDADLVGITSCTCNAPRGYEIAREYVRKGTKTVMGGVHASFMSEEAAQFVDAVVIGEAESIWRGLLADFERNDLKKSYRGERTNLETQIRLRPDVCSRKYRLPSVETSRGCPSDCEFCSVTSFHGRTYRQKPVEDVLDQLESLKSKYFFFMDDNILGFGKQAEERAIRLFQGMIDRGLKKKWGCAVGIDFANNPEVLKYARKAGCSAVFMGFESINEESLEGMHKVRNLRLGVKNYEVLIKKLHDHGIGVMGSFVLGNDGDRKDVFERTAKFVLDSKIDATLFAILCPFPGTRLYNRLMQEGRLLRTNYPHDWKYHDCVEVVFKPKHMSPDELTDGVAQIYSALSSRLTSFRRAFTSAIQTKNLVGSGIAYLWNRGSGRLWLKKYKDEAAA
ncbi:MAG: B12-binding domain-containing radical SAM protein [Dehalococcoidia bacterium]|nr:B12-binding domain-containing radical SAM protein [Dehalococcoidia bacterium]